MLGTGYDLVLKFNAEVTEIVAVPGYADYEVPVLFRFFLGRAQGIGSHDIQLYMMPVHAEVGAYQMNQAVDALFVIEKLGSEFLIEQGSPGSDMIDFTGGFNDRRGAVSVCSLDRRDTFG